MHRLQWGRDLEVAESSNQASHQIWRYWLQWGRDLEVAERSEIAEIADTVDIASMGPRLGSRGKAGLKQQALR